MKDRAGKWEFSSLVIFNEKEIYFSDRRICRNHKGVYAIRVGQWTGRVCKFTG